MEEDYLKEFFTDPIDTFINKYKTKVYQPAVRQNQANNAPVFEDQYSVREAARGGESVKSDPLLTGLPDPATLEAGITMADLMYGKTTPLTEDEQARMSHLSNRYNRLQPIEFGQLGGSGIAGNPYSMDTRGLMTGIGDLAEGIINKERSKRVNSFSDELAGLSGKQAQNREISQNRQKFLGDYIPEQFKNAYKEGVDARTNIAKNEASKAADERKHNYATQLEVMRQDGRENLARLNNQLKIEFEKESSGNYSPSLVTSYSRTAQGAGQQLFDEVNAIDKIINEGLLPEEDINDLKQDREEKRGLAFEFMKLAGEATQGSVPEEAQKKFEDLINKVNGVPAESSTNTKPVNPVTPTEQDSVDVSDLFNVD